MKLYEVQATEYNGEQEYSQSKLLPAENIDQAWEIARDYFRQCYDDGDEPEVHNTDNLDEFEFFDKTANEIADHLEVKEVSIAEFLTVGPV